MAGFAERRKYQRCDTTICKALMSTDNISWDSLDICDISAGGISFVSDKQYSEDTYLYFDVYVYNMLSEFNIKLEGHIIRAGQKEDSFWHALKFDNLNKYTLVQLDELIKSRISISGFHQPLYEQDGTYTFFFIPRTKSGRLNMYK